MDFKNIVFDAGKVLRSHDIGKMPHIEALWTSMQWDTYAVQEIKADAEVNREGAVIRLYPSLRTHPSSGYCVLREFGLFLLIRSGDKGKDIWRNKLALPKKGQIESFQSKLENAEVRMKLSGFIDIIDGYKTACDRYVALNLVNALHVNNIPFKDSEGVDILQWGPTAEYANRQRYHSLVPLTSVYASRDQNENYGVAFADLITEDLQSVRERSVAEEMRKLIKRVAELSA